MSHFHKKLWFSECRQYQHDNALFIFYVAPQDPPEIIYKDFQNFHQILLMFTLRALSNLSLSTRSTYSK